MPAGTLLRRSPPAPTGYPTRALGSNLRAGTPVTIVVLGDSTGNDSSEWVYLFAQWLAARVPSATVNYRVWNNTNQAYDYETVIHRGTAGDRYAVLGATSTANVSTPSAAAFNVTDLDVRIFLTAADYTPASALGLCGRWSGADPNRGWFVQIGTDGKPSLFWYPTGSYASQIRADCDTAVTTRVSDGALLGLRATLDVDNGAGGYEVKFWTCPTPGGSWTQLGATITGGSTTNLPSPSAAIYIGYGSAYGLVANYHQFEHMSGINGYILAACDVDLFNGTTLTFGDAAGRTWTVNKAVAYGGAPGLLVLNGSVSGANVTTIHDQLAAMTPALGARLFFVNLGHNTQAGDWATVYQDLINDVLVRYPTAEPFVCVQNPQKTGAAGYAAHLAKMDTTRALAVTQGYRFAEVYNTFRNYGDYESALMADDTHPSAAGSQVWANVVRSRICRW